MTDGDLQIRNMTGIKRLPVLGERTGMASLINTQATQQTFSHSLLSVSHLI